MIEGGEIVLRRLVAGQIATAARGEYMETYQDCVLSADHQRLDPHSRVPIVLGRHVTLGHAEGVPAMHIYYAAHTVALA